MTEEANSTTPEETKADNGEKLWAILSYVPVICLIPLLQEDSDSQLRQHARQGVVLMLLEILIGVLLIEGVTEFLLVVGLFACMIFAIIAAINAFQGRYWRIPILSDIAEGQGIGRKED